MSSRRHQAHGPSRRFPHCPNRNCAFHRPDPAWKYRDSGTYVRPSDGASYPRYRCTACRRTFTLRTFSADYWLRYRHLLEPIADHSVSGACLRQIGRLLDIHHSTVARHVARAGRHCLLFHREQLEGASLDEALAIDGFETFEYSQFFPFHLNLAAGASSWFIYHFTDSPLRRKGRMTEEQKATRQALEEKLGRPDPKAVQKGMLELLKPLPLAPEQMLHSDDHPAYPRALKDLKGIRPELRITHQITPGSAPRTVFNPLFAVNLADLLLRHCGANHRRETIAYSKRRQGAIERAAIFTVWRNWIKLRREKKPEETAAMAAGLSPGRLRWSEVLCRRLFPREERLVGPWSDYYWHRIKTAALGERQTSHCLKYAF